VSDECEQLPQAVARGDIWTWRDGGDFLVFDAGAVGADHLPAHAHSDLLTIEASLAGHRLIVDSGTFDYSDGPMRQYCRSTGAHNVVQIDDAEQCDMWSRFRMGYRGWPQSLDRGCDDGFLWARAYHNAYRRAGVPRVGRWIACRPGGPWLCVDSAHGRGVHQLTSWLHFHPEVHVAVASDDEVHLQLAEHSARLRYLVPGELSLDTGWYCPEFGVRMAAPVLKWITVRRVPAITAWELSWEDSPGETAVSLDENGSVFVSRDDGHQCRRWLALR
jgi:uncharacterized heparinase superfamily protein